MGDALPYRIDIYIGSDNHSRRIYKDYLGRVTKWADKNLPDGYTLIRGRGCYKGMSEDSVLINVLSASDISLRDSLQKLKAELEQEAIVVVRAPVDFEMI